MFLEKRQNGSAQLSATAINDHFLNHLFNFLCLIRLFDLSHVSQRKREWLKFKVFPLCSFSFFLSFLHGVDLVLCQFTVALIRGGSKSKTGCIYMPNSLSLALLIIHTPSKLINMVGIDFSFLLVWACYQYTYLEPMGRSSLKYSEAKNKNQQ